MLQGAQFKEADGPVDQHDQVPRKVALRPKGNRSGEQEREGGVDFFTKFVHVHVYSTLT